MFKKKVDIIGITKDDNDRKYIAIKKNGDIIVQIQASNEDVINIKNYNLNCITNIQNSSKSSSMNNNFNTYVKYISEDFENYNDKLNRFISRFVYAYSIKALRVNDHNKFIKNKVMFSYYLNIDEIYENGKLFKFKK